MFTALKEDDFTVIKNVAKGRLVPGGISVFSLGALGYGGVILLVTNFAVGYSRFITNPLWPDIIKILLALLIIQALFTFFFLKEKNAYRFQFTQAVFLCIVSFKMSIEMYFVYFLIYEDRDSPVYMAHLGVIALLAGLVVLIISIIRAVGLVKKGGFGLGGQGLFKYRKGYWLIPLLFGAVILSYSVIGRMVSIIKSDLTLILSLSFPLMLCVVIQYGIAMAWPEFFLLAYCKRRFESFKVKLPKRLK
jgi:type III secretory pathway component EscS